jgi:hypothetical protein
MKNTIRVFGFIALAAVIGFSMAACGGDDDSGNKGGDHGGVGVTVTVSIDKIDAKTFTITLDGAKWIAGIGNTSNDSYLYSEDTRTVTITYIQSGKEQTGQVQTTAAFVITRTSNTVVTCTLKDFYTGVSGTIKPNSGNNHGWSADMFSLMDGIDLNKDNTFIINPAKASITFVVNNDLFAGTWLGQGDDNYMTLTTANGSFTVSIDNKPAYKGTYTVSGNTVSLTFTHLNTGLMSGGADSWTPYDDLPPETHDIPPKNIDGTINGNQFIIDTGDDDPMTFTKQG